MSDFNAAYLATRQSRNKADMDAALAEADAAIAAQQPAPQAAPQQSASGAPAQAPQPGQPAQKGPSFLGFAKEMTQETKRAVFGGLQDAAFNVTHLADEAAYWLDDHLLHLRIAPPELDKNDPNYYGKPIPKESMNDSSLAGLVSGRRWDATRVADNETTVGRVSRALVNFAGTYAGVNAITRGAGRGKALAMARGAAADYLGQDPYTDNLANLIMKVTGWGHQTNLSDLITGKTGNYDDIGGPILHMLANDPLDPPSWNRARNALEGLGLGLAAEGLVKVVRAGVARWRAAGKNPLQEVQQAAQEAKPAEDLGGLAVDTSKAPDLSLADQINVLTGVSRNSPSKFQKALDMKAALKDAEATQAKAAWAGKPKPLELADGPLPTTQKASNPDAFLNKGSQSPKITLEDPNGIPFEVPTNHAGEVSFPDAWKLVEKDPNPRKAFLDPEDGHIVMAQEATAPHQINLDDAVGEAMKATERTPQQEAVLNGYKELQEKVLEKAPKPAQEETAKAAADLDARITAAQARVDSLQEAGKDHTAAQRVLDSLLKKKDSGLRDPASKLGAKAADQLASGKDPLVDAIAANNEKLLQAMGKSQLGTITPSMLANMAAMQVGAVSGWMSAEDDATFAERLSLAGAGAVAGLGVKVGASRALRPAERAVLESPNPVAQSLARQETQNIAPLAAEALRKPAPAISMGKVKEFVQAAREGRLGDVAKTASKDAINFARVDSEKDVDELMQAVQGAFSKEMEKSAGGAVRTHEMVKENAELVGSGIKSIEERYQKVANLDAQVLADRQLLQASAEKSRELIQKALESGDDFAVLAAEKQLKLHATLQAKVAGTRTEIARALAAMRITANSADLAINEASALLESLGGKTAKLDYFKKLQEIPTEEGMNKAIRMGAMARTRDALTEAVVMGKLWSPQTHAANAIGNMLTAIGGAAEKGTAALIGKYVIPNLPYFRKFATPGGEQITAGEVKAQLLGMLGGIDDALHITSQGRQALKDAAGQAITGDFKAAKGTLLDNMDEFGGVYRAAASDSPVGRSAVQQTVDAGTDSVYNAISSKAFGLDSEKPIGILVDALGSLNRLPGRALGASDELFWAINYRGELRAQAYRTARQEGLEGDSMMKRIAELVEEPTPEARAVAVQAAQKATFTEPLTGFGKDLQKWVDAANCGSVPIGRMVMPFVRTPYNILKYASERTPLLNFMSDSWMADFKAGGMRRDLALAKVTLGSTLLMMGAVLQTGMTLGDSKVQIVGGGDINQSAEKLNGELPYSIRIGDKSYTFNRLDPIGMFLGLGADLRDIAGHTDDTTFGGLASASILSISRNISSKSYLAGLVDLTTALSKANRGDTKDLERYLRDQAAGLLPASSLTNTIRKEDDPVVREVWSLMDAIKNKLPGYSKDLPPQRNIFGEPVKIVGGLGSDMVSPIRTSQSDTDPIASEIARLNIDLKMPPKTLATAPGAPGIDLSPQQYDRLTEVSGKFFKTELGKVMASERYQRLPENPDNNIYMEGKEAVIRKLHANANLYGTRKLLAEDRGLAAQWLAEKRNAGAALRGLPIAPF